jgi:hypothetical protein
MTTQEAWAQAGYPAQRGLDYVPYDNFLIRAHEGERVQTKEEADDWRGGSSRPGVTIHIHYYGTVIEEKKAAQDIALLVYPQLEKLRAWGH